MDEETPTPFNDYLYKQAEIVTQTGSNKRFHCKKCNQNFTGGPGRIHENLKSKAGDVKGALPLRPMISEQSGTRLMP
jgi:hypothetical protein